MTFCTTAATSTGDGTKPGAPESTWPNGSSCAAGTPLAAASSGSGAITEGIAVQSQHAAAKHAGSKPCMHVLVHRGRIELGPATPGGRDGVCHRRRIVHRYERTTLA